MQKHHASSTTPDFTPIRRTTPLRALVRRIPAAAQDSPWLSLGIYVTIYAIVWTLVSARLDPTVPFDAVEALNWARNAEWGTPKNPWLVGISMWPALGLKGEALAFYWYASHFAAIAVGMLGVWHLAKRLSGDTRLAWLAMLSLHLTGAINIDILPYNDNYLLVMFWPWMLWCFVRAMCDSPGYWIGLGIVAGLAAMTKYSTFALLGAMFVVTLWTPQARRHYRHPAFALGAILFVALIAPNVLWLVEHDFAAFRWVDDQIRQRLNWRGLRGALTAFYPVATLALVMHLAGMRFTRPTHATRLAACAVLPALAPILVYFTLHDGGRISEWLQPFAVPLPALLVGCVASASGKRAWRISRWLPVVGLTVLIGYAAVLGMNLRNAGQKFAGIKAASLEIEQRWNAHYQMPLSFVGHDHLATWLTFYAPSQPRLLMTWSSAQRPNIYTRDLDEVEVRARGAILLGRPGRSCRRASFAQTLALWPSLSVSFRETLPFAYHGGAAPIPLCVAYIAPQR
ncbi:glycosyltransferase family 39 protein [Pandoraea anhela]|uniref:Glycosyltransferase n=1 Tax=Pandoraea anhela TaxID=2508295 RepID=A0A5E4RCJ0_9BURK|nr:glycosyltransferase family 39 protein [Pandoraea anhela]VVD61010.1 glycosyltransferase [Pandoraea anhela]